MKFIYLSLILLISLISCSKDPNPAVSYLIEKESTSSLDGLEAGSALEYSGRDFLGTSCNLILKKVNNNTTPYNWRATTDYLLHGVQLPKIDLFLYSYFPGQDKYVPYSETLNQNGAEFLLIGIRTSDANEFDPNKLEQYQTTGLLKYYLEVQFIDNDQFDTIKNYVDTLNSVNKSPELYSQNQDILDQIRRIKFRLFHTDHYDSGGCLNYAPLSMITEGSN